MRNITIMKKENKNIEFTVKLSANAGPILKIYCETIENEPEMFIKDAIVKNLIQTYIVLQLEEYIYVGDKFLEVKKPLKHFFNAIKLIC